MRPPATHLSAAAAAASGHRRVRGSGAAPPASCSHKLTGGARGQRGGVQRGHGAATAVLPRAQTWSDGNAHVDVASACLGRCDSGPGAGGPRGQFAHVVTQTQAAQCPTQTGGAAAPAHIWERTGTRVTTSASLSGSSRCWIATTASTKPSHSSLLAIPDITDLPVERASQLSLPGVGRSGDTASSTASAARPALPTAAAAAVAASVERSRGPGPGRYMLRGSGERRRARMCQVAFLGCTTSNHRASCCVLHSLPPHMKVTWLRRPGWMLAGCCWGRCRQRWWSR